MIRRPRFLLTVSILFVALELLLAVLLQITSGLVADACRFGSTLLACSFCFLLMENTATYAATQLGLLFALGADFFLVICSPMQQLLGMIFFSMVQLAYFARLHAGENDARLWKRHGLWGAVLASMALIATLVVLRERADAVSLVSMFYLSVLVVNLLVAVPRIREHALLTVGLLLFFCGDILVGLNFLGDYIMMHTSSAYMVQSVVYPGFDLAWAFYLPSQMLIALSLLPARLRECRAVADR